MVFLLNMIRNLCHWYHNFEPNPCDILSELLTHKTTKTSTTAVWPGREAVRLAHVLAVKSDLTPQLRSVGSGDHL